MANKKNDLRVFEVVWYSICAAVALWGLVYIVLGLVANYANVPHHDNYLLEASNVIKRNFGLGFFGWGLIIFAIGVVAAIFVMLIYAAKVDKTSEKAARRAARLAKLQADMAEEVK